MGDKFFSEINWSLTDGDQDDLEISGTLSFNWVQGGAPGFAGDFWTVVADFTEGENDFIVGEANGEFSYRVDILDPEGAGWTFDTVKHESDSVNPVTLSTKVVDFDGDSVELVSENGNPAGPVSIGGKFIVVTDTWSVTVTDEEVGALDSISNTFTQKSEVPGPLPILGAGAAFGFSRRLRSRIKGSRLA